MKREKISVLIALIITLVLFGIDTVGALSPSRDMLIEFEEYGGECINYVGIGWNVLVLYPMSSPDNPAPASAPKLSFNLISLLVVFVAAWLISWIILCIFSKNWKRILIFIGGIAACALLFLLAGKAYDAYKSTITELVGIQVYTADINPDGYYAVNYPKYVYSFVPAGENGRLGQCLEIPLQAAESKEISKKQIKRLLAATEQLKNDSKRERDSNGHPFAYTIEIRVKTHGGISTISFDGYNEVPDSWSEFVSVVNEICGENYLSTNPDMVVFSNEWFCDAFGVTESDMPEGGNLDRFIETVIGGSKYGIPNISGANDHQFESLIRFDLEREFEYYAQRLSDSE